MSRAEAVARKVIKRLQSLGNFDEFRDHREPDGVNLDAVIEIADVLAAEFLLPVTR